MRRDELAAAAADVTYLRGLLALPIGVLFVLTGVGNLGWRPLASPWTFGPCLLVLGLAAWRIQLYYNDSFGRVRAARHKQVAYGIATLALGIAMLGGSYADFRLDLPISLFAITFGAAMLLSFHLYTGLKQHQVVIWGGLLVLGLVPLWGSFDDRVSVAWIPIGVATFVAGLLDHRLLIATTSARQLDGATV
jgi:hypothetical protein